MVEPLQVPRMDYVSADPYFVTLEWVSPGDEGLISTKTCGDLEHALFMSLHPSAPIGEDGEPDRRVVVDARGVTIFGYLADCTAEVCHVITTEVADLMRSLGLDEVLDVLTLELEMAWRQ